MKSLMFLPAVALAASLPAQRGQQIDIVTTTGYGVLAELGSQNDFDGVPARTVVGPRGLHVMAHVPGRQSNAVAATSVQLVDSRTTGRGVVVRERGFVGNDDPMAAGRAGTSDSGPRMPQLGTHGLRITFPALPGDTGEVLLVWQGNASARAGGGVTVDVDGDGTPDFAARMNGTPARQAIPVRVGRGGLNVGVQTTGQCGVRGQGRAGYDGALSLFFRPTGGGGGGTCAFRPFGTDCGAHIDGAARPSPTSTGQTVVISVHGPAQSLGVLAIGGVGRPQPLPFSRCSLLIDTSTAGSGFRGFFTDRAGDADVPFHLPPRLALDINFQALVLQIGARGPQLVASNGLHLTCR